MIIKVELCIRYYIRDFKRYKDTESIIYLLQSCDTRNYDTIVFGGLGVNKREQFAAFAETTRASTQIINNDSCVKQTRVRCRLLMSPR